MEIVKDDDERAGKEPAFTSKDSRKVKLDEFGELVETPDEEAPPVEEKPTFVAYLEKQLAERDAALKEATDRQRRAIAELERARERIERDARRQVEQAGRDLVAGLLPVIDDLDRALAAARESGRDPALTEGVELARRRFLNALADRGVTREEPLGQPFDPARHEAVSTLPAEPGQANTVLAVIQPGYVMGDALIRPALVAVGR